MNIYVVSSCWWRNGATVIGAATDRAGAEVIADRHPEDDSSADKWAPWKEDVSAAEGSCTWSRDALLVDGTVHPSLYQEIVCVPLAGSELNGWREVHFVGTAVGDIVAGQLVTVDEKTRVWPLTSPRD
jgi:hypothetical protein